MICQQTAPNQSGTRSGLCAESKRDPRSVCLRIDRLCEYARPLPMPLRVGDHRTRPPPANRGVLKSDDEAEIDSARSRLLGRPFPDLASMEERPPHRSARDGRALAP